MRRSIAAAATAAVLAATVPAPASAAWLNDIGSHWAQAQIQAGVNDGYINGFPDGSFRPDQKITRAEFFKLLAAAVQLKPQPSMEAPFPEKSHWSMQQGQIQAAISGGLIYPPDYGNWFAPDAQVTRQEIVLAAVRAVGKQSLVGQLDLTTTDAATYPEWLQDWAAVAVNDGLLTGYEDGSLNLQRSATRAEALVIVQRVLKQVTMNLVPSDVEAAPNTVRHPAEGEPVWTVTTAEESPRPTFSDGTYSYPVNQDVRGFLLLPAPGKAAWLTVVVDDKGEDQYRVFRLQGGNWTEAGRYFGGATPVAVDAGGRFWFSVANDLVVADQSGATTRIPVGDRILAGEIDWQGNLWGAGLTSLFKITADAKVGQIEIGLTDAQQIRHVAAGEDGSVWLLLTGATDGSRVEAMQIVDGKFARRMPLFGRYFGGEGRAVQAAVLGRSGPFHWVIALAEGGGEAEQQESLFKFDLEAGTFTRLVPPRSVGGSPALAPAPDGGALLRDTAGKFWRVTP